MGAYTRFENNSPPARRNLVKMAKGVSPADRYLT